MKGKAPGIVTLITDFGLQGEYVGAMKGAILRVNPRCQLVDITHQVEPQNLLQAAFILQSTYPYYPAGTVHLVVVDPGVGTSRRPIICQKGGHTFVGPDNGVFTLVFSGQERRSGYLISENKYFLSPLSRTFHGRDLFAPVAGHLSLGRDPKQFGPPVSDLSKLAWPSPDLRGSTLRGQILWADSFGNLITNIPREYGALLEDHGIQIKGKGWRILRLHQTYGEGRPGQPLALFGSAELMEISVNQGNALRTLGIGPGDPLRISLRRPTRGKAKQRAPVSKPLASPLRNKREGGKMREKK